MFMQPSLLFCYIAISSITPLISSQVIISDDYLKSNADQRTPTRWSQPYPSPKVVKMNENISGDADEERRDANQEEANKEKRDRSNIDQIQSAPSYHHNSYQAPIKEYHHTSHEHHEHHESTHIKEYHPDANHRAHPHDIHPPPHHAHHYDAPNPPVHHHSVPILGHMLGHVPYSHANHGHERAPAISDVYRSQDSHGNYGFGYETRTIDGNHDYRHEKKIGEATEGAYGYKTDTAHAHNTFKHVPIHSDPPIYHEHPNYGQVHSVPISDIPPAASRHSVNHHDHSVGHPGHYPPNIINLGHTSISPVDILSRYQSPPPPLYHSEYDMEIPYALYSHLLDDIFKSDESIHDIVLPPEPVEPSSATEFVGTPLVSDAIRGIFDSNHINSYLSYLDKVMPSGIHSRLSNPPLYRDRKKKRR